MAKENIGGLEAEAKRLSVTVAKRANAIVTIDHIIKNSLSPRELIRVAKTRTLVNQSINQISKKIAKIEKRLEPHYLTEMKQMLANGALTEAEVPPHLLEKLKKIEVPSGKTEQQRKSDKKPVAAAVQKETTAPVEKPEPKPTLKINKDTGDFTVIKNDKTSLPLIIKSKVYSSVLLKLAENSKQPTGGKIIDDTAVNAGSQSARPAGNAIGGLRSVFERIDPTFKFVIRTGNKNNPAYALNMNVEIVGEEKTAMLAEKVNKTKKEIVSIKEITLDKETQILTINGISKRLTGQYFSIASYLYDHQNQKFSGKDLAKILAEQGSATRLGDVMMYIENKFGFKFITRETIKKTTFWSLDVIKEDAKPTAAPMFDRKTGTITVDGKKIQLRDTEFILLDYLDKNRGNKSLLTREAIYAELKKAGSRSSPHWIIDKLEIRAGRQLFRRDGRRIVYDLEFLQEKAEKAKTSTENIKKTEKNIRPTEQIVFDVNKKLLTVGEKTVSLSPQETLLVSAVLVFGGKQGTWGSELSEILKSKGARTSPGRLIFQIEKRFGEEIFTRGERKKTKGILWSLDAQKKAEKSPIVPVSELNLSMTAALDLIINNSKVTPETLIKTLGKSTKTEELLHAGQARFALMRTVGILSSKFREGTLSKEERQMWDRIEALHKQDGTKLIDRIKSIFPTKSDTVEKVPQVENENSFILTPEETEIMMALICVKDNTKIVFDKDNEVIFRAPKWIISESAKSKPNRTYNPEALQVTRKTIAEKVKRIIQKNREGGQTIDMQLVEEAGYMLSSIDGRNNLPEDTRTKNKALTVNGFMNFILSDGKQNRATTKANTTLYVAHHEVAYSVPQGDAVDIEPVKKAATENKPEKQTEPAKAAVAPVVETALFERSAHETKELASLMPNTPTQEDNIKNKKESKQEKLKAQALIQTTAVRTKLGLFFDEIKKKGIYETQIPSVLPDISPRDIRKLADNGSILVQGERNKDMLSLEEIILITILKDNHSFSRKDVKQLRKLIKAELR